MNYLEIHKQPCSCPFCGAQKIVMDSTDAHRSDMEKLKRSNVRLRAILMELEYLKNSDGRMCCPLCNATFPFVHSTKCPIKIALEDVEK